MTASQDQIILEHEKTDFNPGIDAKERQTVDRSTSKTEPIDRPITDDGYTQKTWGSPKSDQFNYRCQHTNNSVKHDSIIADYKMPI